MPPPLSSSLTADLERPSAEGQGIVGGAAPEPARSTITTPCQTCVRQASNKRTLICVFSSGSACNRCRGLKRTCLKVPEKYAAAARTVFDLVREERFAEADELIKELDMKMRAPKTRQKMSGQGLSAGRVLRSQARRRRSASPTPALSTMTTAPSEEQEQHQQAPLPLDLCGPSGQEAPSDLVEAVERAIGRATLEYLGWKIADRGLE
ncbi:hypothetical protein T310_0201 [Rasamsonia emersonii CBS 393.64]|uniref:Uncharacterized protein n=1 Tax=Rasamsonia emersonii (strain ATCC 16479 / CBS 393.64 / IMI 116815) TaxID=1408163 RepID=A0A0F4Z665_RASE3|nr:hypothetical protein T310_0201 [Rasamsonia emersonii CBS 393.64]KKA25815.1 hypothetical protein T310_0201 [Rasamsonia emersonii CBS 393.64]